MNTRTRKSPDNRSLLQLLDPLIVVLSLFACEFVWGERLTAGWASLVLLIFVISGPLFAGFEASDSRRSSSAFIRTCSLLLLRWLFVVATLLLCAYAFKVSAELPRRVFLTWFVATPILLMIFKWFRDGSGTIRWT